MRDEYDITNLNPRRNFHVTGMKEKMIENTFTSDEGPFFSAENISELERGVSDVCSGKSTLQEHDLIEAE